MPPGPGVTPRTTALAQTVRLLLGVCGVLTLGLAAAGCGSGDPKAVASSAPSGTSASAGEADSTTVTELSTSGGQVIASEAVACHLAKRRLGGIIASDEGRSDTPCTERHNQESFTLVGTTDLDDCYRAVAASSDVSIGTDSFSNDKLDFTDDRIIGHTFATSDVGTVPPGQASEPGAQGTISCAVDLADDRTTPLIGGSGM